MVGVMLEHTLRTDRASVMETAWKSTSLKLEPRGLESLSVLL